MLFWTLQITTISIILIFLVHHLFGFFKSTLTVPKVKDLVNAPAHKYEMIYNTIATNASASSSSGSSSNSNSNINTTPISPVITVEEKPDLVSMKNELKSFLKNKLKNAGGEANTTSIEALDSTNGGNSLSYSPF
jgi:hypothetical protein